MKYLFLDFDGVISIQESKWELSDKKQELLGKIIQETDCYLVISSSWREHNVEETKIRLKEKGFLFCDRIVGVTIRAYNYIQKGIHLSIPRGVEIKQWLDTHVYSNNGKDYEDKEIGVDFTYCIVDDDIDMLLEQSEYFVNTYTFEGLTIESASRIIEILNNIKQ